MCNEHQDSTERLVAGDMTGGMKPPLLIVQDASVVYSHLRDGRLVRHNYTYTAIAMHRHDSFTVQQYSLRQYYGFGSKWIYIRHTTVSYAIQYKVSGRSLAHRGAPRP
jgi:hypothetical protein